MAQLDDHENRHLMIEEIEDYRMNEESRQGTYKTKSGFNRKKRTTKSMGILCYMEGRIRGLDKDDKLKGFIPSTIS